MRPGLPFHRFSPPGVAYSFSTVSDALVNTRQCQIDAGLIKEMGANTIRVYRVDGSQNHDGCMQAFASQNIYVWLDLTNPERSISRVRRHHSTPIMPLSILPWSQWHPVYLTVGL